jgi:hypothetical protein
MPLAAVVAHCCRHRHRVAPVPDREEVAVPFVVVSPPGFKREQYEETVRRLHPDGRLESPSDWPVEGLLAHVAGEGASGFRVIDVWESEEAVGRFAELLAPVLQELGVEGQPEIYPADTFIAA